MTAEIVRIGKVSSVNVGERTARVIFENLDNLSSAELPVIQNHPLITITKTENGEKWNFEAHYASVNRNLGLGESYSKGAPDTIKLTKSIDYKCPLHGVDETKQHEHYVKVYPWLPYVGQTVVCIYTNQGDGVIIGGL